MAMYQLYSVERNLRAYILNVSCCGDPSASTHEREDGKFESKITFNPYS